ncbi:MAG TPA: DUF4381 family protein [Microbacterium sp.]|uniref:DUF4381 family protein n=1 Tax=Microbacterium sp. TaxID=51671 RepID=UPI002B466F6E|nr:DUF4381 family protein [Microbacterium sp.]HKT57420.1 DUF4381 family protein [Microbacterium sp.]
MHPLLIVLSAATPSPSPTGPDPTSVTPGAWGFGAILLIALVAVLLVWDMMRRIRRGRYRAEVREELDAEQAASDTRDDEPRD